MTGPTKPTRALIPMALLLACVLALFVALAADLEPDGRPAPSPAPTSPGSAATVRAPAADPTLTPIPGLPPAPTFELKDREERPLRLADYRGRPVILNFWATWCPPCREEMPSMQRAHEILSRDGISVVAINVGEDADTIARFLADVPVDFPLPMDPDSLVVRAYPVIGLPTTFVIDPEGRIAYEAKGEREWDDPELLDRVRALKR